MPPCLADRIVEEHRAGGTDNGEDGGASPRPPRPPPAGKRCISLAGGFLFIRGVFYVTRPVEGEVRIHPYTAKPRTPTDTSTLSKCRHTPKVGSKREHTR